MTYSVIRKTWISAQPSKSIVHFMVLVCLAIVLAAQAYWVDLEGFKSQVAASPESVFKNHQFYRLWSTLFVHADFKHLFSNLFMFFILGVFLTHQCGRWVMLSQAIFWGGVTNLAVLWQMPSGSTLIGASGIVFWMGGVWLSLFLLIDRTRTLYQRSLRSIGVGLLIFFPGEAFDPSISYRAHFYGFFLGVVWGFLYFIIYKKEIRAAEISELIEDANLPVT